LLFLGFIGIILYFHIRSITSGIRALSWAQKWRIFLYFCRDFWAASLQIRSVCFGDRSAKPNCRSVFFVKKYPISKKNRLNRGPDEGDITDLKISGVADNFSRQQVCGADLDVLVQDLQNIIVDLYSL